LEWGLLNLKTVLALQSREDFLRLTAARRLQTGLEGLKRNAAIVSQISPFPIK